MNMRQVSTAPFFQQDYDFSIHLAASRVWRAVDVLEWHILKGPVVCLHRRPRAADNFGLFRFKPRVAKL